MKRLLSLLALALSAASLHADYWRWVQTDNGHTYYYVDSLDYGVERFAYLGVHDAGGVLVVSPDGKNDDSTAWHLMPTGNVSPYTLQPTYYIRNVGTGRYVSGVGRTSRSLARAWDWVFYPANADTLYRGYPTICHFVEDGDTLLGHPLMEGHYASIDLNNIFPILYEYVLSHYAEFELLRDSLQSDGKAVEDFYVVGGRMRTNTSGRLR